MKVRVKICGLASEAALDAAIEAGADALGFVLAPSPRRVSHERARELLARVPAEIEKIAVFARATGEEIAAALELDFDGIQAESAGPEIPELPRGVFFLPVIRDGAGLLQRLGGFPSIRSPLANERSLRGAHVLDGPLGGGRGIPVDEQRARRAAQSRRLVLAGGLTPENVAARLCAIRPFGVDTSSGVESERGLKDPERIRAFVAAVRAVEVELSSSSAEIHT